MISTFLKQLRKVQEQLGRNMEGIPQEQAEKLKMLFNELAMETPSSTPGILYG